MSELAEKLDALIDEAKDGGIIARLPAADLIALAVVARDAAALSVTMSRPINRPSLAGYALADMVNKQAALDASLAALAKEIG